MRQMETYQSLQLVYSKAGHDKGKLYVIKSVEAEYVYLVDGIHKLLANPKKKKIKHIQIIKEVPESLQLISNEGKKVTDEDIKRAIMIFLKQ